MKGITTHQYTTFSSFRKLDLVLPESGTWEQRLDFHGRRMAFTAEGRTAVRIRSAVSKEEEETKTGTLRKTDRNRPSRDPVNKEGAYRLVDFTPCLTPHVLNTMMVTSLELISLSCFVSSFLISYRKKRSFSRFKGPREDNSGEEGVVGGVSLL